MGQPSRYSEEMREWLANNRFLSSKALETGFFAKFGVHETGHHLVSKLNRMGYKKRDMITDEKLKFMKDNYPDCEDTYKFLEAYNKKFNTHFSLQMLESKCAKYGIKRNVITVRPYQRSKIGHEYIDSEGVVLIKVRPEVNTCKSYITKTKFMYQKYYGVQLSKEDIVIQLDGDRMNFKKDNLVLVSKSELSTLIGYKWLGHGKVTKAAIEWIRARNECNKYINDKHKKI